MIIDVDGSVRAGTVPALVERLTSHDPSGMSACALLPYFIQNPRRPYIY
jgi:hypothetical protein